MDRQHHTSDCEQSKERVTLYNGRTAKKKLQIIVVGCGIGGLATAYALGQAGHDVTVIESSPSIEEIGAGIQVGPNLSRILIRWGLGSIMKSVAENDKPTWFTFRRYDTGEYISMSRLEGKLDSEFGAPWHVVHRADLRGMLFSIASPFMSLRLNSRVVAMDVEDQDRPSVALQTGEIISADLIIGADGIHSVVRGYVTGQTELPLSEPTGDVAYRLVLPTHTFMDDPQLSSLIREPRISCWIGPGKHVIGYCIRNRKEYNMVLVKGGQNEHEYSWTAKGDVEEMRAGFTEWDPCVQKLLSRAEEVLESKLIICSPLKSWIHRSGRVVLMGDSCHPTLPYRAQGSAMAVEDAAVLGNLFSRILHRSEIPELLKAYENIRHARVSATQVASALNKKVYHLADGKEQEERDAAMRSAMKAELLSYEHMYERGLPITHLQGNPNAWSDKNKNAEQFSYDPDEAVEMYVRSSLLGRSEIFQSKL